MAIIFCARIVMLKNPQHVFPLLTFILQSDKRASERVSNLGASKKKRKSTKSDELPLDVSTKASSSSPKLKQAGGKKKKKDSPAKQSEKKEAVSDFSV